MTRKTRGSGDTERRAPPREVERPPLLAAANALFVDIDGTLLHLADTPDEVVIGPEIHALLAALLAKLDGALALVTGRSIADVDRLFSGPALPIAGQHGCERRRADGTILRHTVSEPDLGRIRRRVESFAQAHPGILVENKGSTIAVHFRLAPELADAVHRMLGEQIAATAPEKWTLQRGKCVAELRPGGHDKGTAILQYLEEAPFQGRIPVFVGDDQTDEFGFAAVASRGGWAVKVGPGPSVARYRLANVGAVRDWLRVSASGGDSAMPGRARREP